MTIRELAISCNTLDELIRERGFEGHNIRYLAAALEEEVQAAADARGLTIDEMYDKIDKERGLA